MSKLLTESKVVRLNPDFGAPTLTGATDTPAEERSDYEVLSPKAIYIPEDNNKDLRGPRAATPLSNFTS